MVLVLEKQLDGRNHCVSPNTHRFLFSCFLVENRRRRGGEEERRGGEGERGHQTDSVAAVLLQQNNLSGRVAV